MEEYLFLLCGAICQVFTGGLHGLQSPSILNWTLLDRGHADRLGKHLEISDKILYFLIDIHQRRYLLST